MSFTLLSCQVTSRLSCIGVGHGSALWAGGLANAALTTALYAWGWTWRPRATSVTCSPLKGFTTDPRGPAKPPENRMSSYVGERRLVRARETSL